MSAAAGIKGCPVDADIREVAFVPSDTDEIDFEEKKRRAIERFIMMGDKNTF